MPLAILVSHPIQYYAPLFRALARRADIVVLYAHRATEEDQAKAGFGVGFEWDVDLLDGYPHRFLPNVARRPGLDHFAGVDAPAIARELEGGGYEALLVMGWHLKAYIRGVLAAKRRGIPVMVRGDSQLDTPRSAFKRTVKAVVYRPFLRLFDAALYVGEKSRAYWRHYGYPEERLFFSPHCVDTEWFAARATAEARAGLRGTLGIDSQEKAILFAGKLQPFKRPLDLVKACGRLRAAGMSVSLMVAGAGELEDAMRREAKAQELPLHMLGFCNQSEMPSVYAAADVLVLPSDAGETWGLVANEALACGTPIVVSDACGCAPDLAGDGEAGRVFPVGDVDALAEAMGEVLAAPPSSQKIAERSERYSIEAAADGILEALRHVTRSLPRQATAQTGAYKNGSGNIAEPPVPGQER